MRVSINAAYGVGIIAYVGAALAAYVAFPLLRAGEAVEETGPEWTAARVDASQ